MPPLMPLTTALIRKNAWLKLILLALALAVKALVPTGFMLSAGGERFLTVTICADASGTAKQMRIALPNRDDAGNEPSEMAEKREPCAFSGIGHAALDGADPAALVAALVFILLAGFAAIHSPVLPGFAFLRPPLRGPPVSNA